MIKRIIKILYFILLITFIILMYLITKLNIIPNKFYYLILVSILILSIVLGILVFISKNKPIKIICIIIICLLQIITSFGIYYIYSTDSFLNNIENVNENNIYYVIVNKNSNYKTINDLNNKKIVTLETQDNSYSKAIKNISSKINIDKITYKNMYSAYTDLIDNKINSILINSNTKEIIEETNPKFKDKTKIIYTIKIKLENKEINKTQTNTDSFNVLISGIDTYGSIDKVSRSDVNIIATINSNTHRILLTSIPRDMHVQLHGTTGIKDKLTHAGIYGIDMSRKTLEDFLNTEIPYYVRVNFDSLVKLVDSIGGIEVNNDIEFRGNTRYFNKGTIHLNGTEALEYARERKKMPYGDWSRGLHQEEIIRAVIEKVSHSSEILTNYSEILSNLENFFQTNIPTSTIKKYTKNQLESSSIWNIQSTAVAGSGSNLIETYSMPGMKLYVTYPEEKSRLNISKEINNLLIEK